MTRHLVLGNGNMLVCTDKNEGLTFFARQKIVRKNSSGILDSFFSRMAIPSKKIFNDLFSMRREYD